MEQQPTASVGVLHRGTAPRFESNTGGLEAPGGARHSQGQRKHSAYGAALAYPKDTPMPWTRRPRRPLRTRTDSTRNDNRRNDNRRNDRTRTARSPRRSTLSDGLPRAVWLLLAGRCINQLGAFTLPFLALTLTARFGASLALVAAVMAAFGAATLISRLLGARLSRWLGHRTTITVGLLATATAQLALALAPSLPVALVAVVAFGVAFELYEPSSQALIAEVTPAAQRPRAYALLSAALGVAGVGAGLLATAAAAVDLRWVFVVDAATCLLAAAVLHRALRSTSGAGAVTSSDEEAALAGPAWRDQRLLALSACGVVFAAVYLQLSTTLSLTLQARGLPAERVGLLFAVSAAVVLAGQPLMKHRRLAQLSWATAMTAGYLLLGVGLGALGVASTMGQFAAAIVVAAFADLILLGRAFTLVAQLAPAGREADYFAVYGLTWGAAAVVGPAAGTGLLSAGGPVLLWSCCAAACLVLAVVQQPLQRLLAAG
ncbi:MFS transporter [Kineococcus sp. NPDC059986]|uniref:MFS transporter n=1 Tax=Kineococcus sp. NPDC059986 TaxID=3155538 RepID=UPI00344D6FF3